jgi:hypothetical protein
MYLGTGFASYGFVLRLRDIVFFIVQPELNVQLGRRARAHKGRHVTSVLYTSGGEGARPPKLWKSETAATSLA